ncbi:TspO/MBR family protein [Leucobacter japonicus]|uniref:TspO/MBR family protein n=1 Tax=Leucobacter japonicus TaxID=1461259 RepID=UPI0009E3C167|nr:TspO/MBR family protein [Leucobacter japonicus]
MSSISASSAAAHHPAHMAPPALARQVLAAALFLIIVAAVAFGGSLASTDNVDGWYAGAEKVAWNPPNAVFGPTWTLLYALLALAGFLIWRSGFREGEPNAARNALALFVTQLALNAMWTPAFFAGYPAIGPAAWWIAAVIIVALIVVVIALAVSARRWSRIAAWIMLPYLAWLCFATSLNIGIIVLN